MTDNDYQTITDCMQCCEITVYIRDEQELSYRKHNARQLRTHNMSRAFIGLITL